MVSETELPTPAGDENFEQRAQALLQDSAEQLDGYTRSRLTQARHAALEAVKQRQGKVWHWLLPASGAVAAAVFAVILAVNPVRQNIEQIAATSSGVDELEIVTAEESLEFYRDVEFYAWLDTVLDDETPANAESEA